MPAIPNFWIENMPPPQSLNSIRAPSCIIARVSWKRGRFQRNCCSSRSFRRFWHLVFHLHILEWCVKFKYFPNHIGHRNSGIYHISGMTLDVLELKAPWHSQTSQSYWHTPTSQDLVVGGVSCLEASSKSWLFNPFEQIWTHNLLYIYICNTT